MSTSSSLTDERLKIEYSFKAMSIDSFAMNDMKMLNQALASDDQGRIKLSYDFQVAYTAFKDLQVIQLQLTVNVSGFKKSFEDKKIDICHLKAAYDFKIVSFLDLFNKEQDLVVPFRLFATFVSIGYGTTRGVLYTKMLGTPLGNFTMPMLNLMNLPKEDLIIKKDAIQTSSLNTT